MFPQLPTRLQLIYAVSHVTLHLSGVKLNAAISRYWIKSKISFESSQARNSEIAEIGPTITLFIKLPWVGLTTSNTLFKQGHPCYRRNLRSLDVVRPSVDCGDKG